MISFFAKKCKDNSFTASLKIDFYINNTLAPDLIIFLTNSTIYFLSSFKILSIAA